MLSLVPRHVPRFLPSSVFSRAQRPAWSRTLITTPRIFAPATKKPVVKTVKPAPTTKKATTAKTKTTKAVKPKKRAIVKKPVGRPKAPKPKGEKKPPRLRRLKPEEKPPKQPGSAYALFTSKYFAGQPKGVDVKETVKICASTWKQLSELEREPFYIEWREKRDQYLAQRTAYWDNVDAETVTIINKRRKRSGKPKLKPHFSEENKKPVSSYLRFSLEHRNDPEVLKQVENLDPLTKQRKIVTILGGMWSNLDKATKQRYIDEAAAARHAWQERRSST